MNSIDYRVSLDMFDVSSQTTIKAKKGDSACKIHITLTENGKIYKITEGCYATFSGKKADGTFVYDNCTIENNTIVYDFISSATDDGVCQITACEGTVKSEVVLFNKNGKRLTAPRFVIVVDGTVYNGEEIISSPEANALKELVSETETLIEDIETKLANGDFVGDKGDKGEKGDTGAAGKDAVTDQTFDPESENAQSGVAVAEAIGWETLVDVTLDETTGGVNEVKVEIPIDKIKDKTEFYFYMEFVADRDYSTDSLWCSVSIVGYWTDIYSSSIWNFMPYYNAGNYAISSGGTCRTFANATMKNDVATSLTHRITHYTEGNSNDSARTVISPLQGSLQYIAETKVVGFRFNGNNLIMPSGTHILFLGRR